jgi:hypothetical protein
MKTPAQQRNPRAKIRWAASERASSVFLPGYSKDGRYAVVKLHFPWRGRMHSGEVTYIIKRTDRGWKVLLRDFIYYV